MKLKKLTLVVFALATAVALSVTGCKKDKGGDDKDGKGTTEPQNGPIIEFYSTGVVGDLYWTYQNRTLDLGVKVNIGIYITSKNNKKVSKLQVIRENISGPGKGDKTTVFDTTLNEVYATKTLVKEQLRTDGVVAAQIAVFTIIATDEDGNTSEKSVEVSPAISVDQRTGTVWNRDEDMAFDLLQAVAVAKTVAKATHDIELATSGNGFKFVSGNGSKFKLYTGTAVGLDRFGKYEDIDNAWSTSGKELTETPLLEEESSSYKFILIKSSQNQRVYILQLYIVEDDHIEFDYIGEIN